MEENSELEEGEACYYKDNDDDDNGVDPDVALSYLEDKIQNVLGHFQKCFEGGVAAENLGAQYGAYGSFLPTYERSSSIWSCPKTPQRSSSTPRSPKNLSVEGAFQGLKVPPNVPPSERLGTASCTANALHNLGVASGNVSVKRDSGSSSALFAQKAALKDENSNKSGNSSDQRTLRVRIKLGSDNITQKKSAIYRGLGLDNSPSSSLGNSPEESGGMLLVSQETAAESPTSILHVMTSFPIPGSALISPLHDSLLCLIRRERLSREGKSVTPLKGSQERSALLVDESVSVMGNRKQSKENEAKLPGKSERVVEAKRGNAMNFDSDTTFSAKKVSENDTQDGKDILFNNLKHIGDSTKATGRASEVSTEASEEGVRDRLFSSNLVKEDSLESISCEDSGKSEKRNSQSGLVGRVTEHRAVTCGKDDLVVPGGSGRCKNNKTFTSLKAHSDASKSKEAFNVGSMATSMQKIVQEVTFHVQDENTMSCGRPKALLEGKKKLQGIESSKKSAARLMKESLVVGVSLAPKDIVSASNGVSTNGDKMHKLKSQKDINKVRDGHRHSLHTNLKQKNNQTGLTRRPSGDRPKDSSHNDLERNASFGKSKEMPSGKIVDRQLMLGASSKDPAHMGPHVAQNALASEVVPPAVYPVYIQDNWVQCENCHKWRLLPYGMKTEQLPEKWLCHMLDWLSGMNHCEISEEETTMALNALYQLPVAEGQTLLQNPANGTAASGLTSAHDQHHGQSRQSLDSLALLPRGKKKHGLKETLKAGSSHGPTLTSNFTKNHMRNSRKGRSLDDMNRPSAEPDLMNKSSFHRLNKAHNLVAEKQIPKQKEIHMNGGDVKQAKMKKKREPDPDEHGASKKTKTEDMYHADKHQNFDLDLGRVAPNSQSGLRAKASGKNMQKSNEYSSEDVKHQTRERLLVSVKKLRVQAEASLDSGSLNMRTGDKKDTSVKKRKLKDWQDNQNGHGSYRHAEESGESELKKEKKSRVSKSVAKEGSMNSPNDKINKKGIVAQLLFSGSGSRDHPVDGIKDIGNIHVELPPRKHRRKFPSQQAFDGVDSVRKDFQSAQASMAATSSSSKVSGSLKTRAAFDEVSGSPVESVSSSPLRNSHPKTLTLTRGDILGKDDAINGGLPVTGKVMRCWDAEGNGETNVFGTARKEKVPGQCHPELFKVFPSDWRDGDANCKMGENSRPSSDLPNGDPENVENHQHLSDMLAVKNCHGDDRLDKNQHENVLFLPKSVKGSAPRTKDNDRSSTSDFARSKLKVSDPLSKQGDLCSKKSTSYDSEIDPKSHASLHKTINDVEHGIPDKPRPKSSKDKKDHVGRIDSVAQHSKDGRMENQLKLEGHDNSGVKLGVLCSRTWNVAPQQNLIQNVEGENKADPIQKESRIVTPQFSQYEGVAKRESLNHRSEPGSQLGEAYPSSNGDMSKAQRHLGNGGTKNEALQNMGHMMPDLRGARDFNVPSPGITNSSSQTATDALNKARDLQHYADVLKASGFAFESNEANFQAALKFLHGASLLETSNSGAVKQGEMTQMEVYGTTAKLCECCALEYERRCEMAAAALAYKCMEVAYWRVVYSKNSSSSRDRKELQAVLQTIPQGESPSSSASDVDNLNNQATVDKATFSKGIVSHVAGKPVVVARNNLNFLRLLDFTQDVNFAVEASRKSQNAFSAANVALEGAPNRECIMSVKRVLDFSFQDVEGFIRLVQLAMEAISRSGFGGERD